MAKYQKRLRASFSSTLAKLERGIENSGLSVQLVDQSTITLNGVKVAVRVYDKYFFRNGNRASLTLTVVGDQDDVTVSAIGAGGGSGVLFNFSLGAEDNLVELVQRIVEE